MILFTSPHQVKLLISESQCRDVTSTQFFIFFLFLKSHKSKQDYDRSLVLCWRGAAVTVSCSDLTLLRLFWLNFRLNPVCYQCSGTMSGCLLGGSGVSMNRIFFFFFFFMSGARGGEWSGVGTAAISAWLPLSLSLSLCLYTVCQDPINSHSSRGERRRSAATLKELG